MGLSTAEGSGRNDSRLRPDRVPESGPGRWPRIEERHENMLATPDLSLVYILVLFGCAYFVLKGLLFGPILSVLDERERDVTTSAEAHARALEEAKVAISRTEERLSSSRRAAITLRQSLRAEGQAARQKKIDAARAEAEKILAAERGRLEEQIPGLRKTLKGQAESLAAEVVSRIVGRSIA